MQRLISVLRRPTGILALISARTGPFCAPGGDAADPYREELQPLASTSEAICPWRDKDVKAWRALGRVDNMTPRSALAIIRSLIGSVADPAVPVGDLGAPHLNGPTDLRPYLCSPASEQLLVDQMNEALEAATADTGFPDWHWRRRQDLAALPGPFRRSFLWGLHLSPWEVVEQTLALYQALDLAGQPALRRAVARLLSFADRPIGLAWGELIRDVDPGLRTAAVELVLETGAHGRGPDPDARALLGAGRWPAAYQALGGAAAS